MFKKLKNLLLITILCGLVVGKSYANEVEKISEQGKQKLLNLIKGNERYLNIGNGWRGYQLIVGGEIFDLEDGFNGVDVYLFNKNICKDNQVKLFFSETLQSVKTIGCDEYSIKENENDSWLKISLNDEENKKIKEFLHKTVRKNRNENLNQIFNEKDNLIRDNIYLEEGFVKRYLFETKLLNIIKNYLDEDKKYETDYIKEKSVVIKFPQKNFELLLDKTEDNQLLFFTWVKKPEESLPDTILIKFKEREILNRLKEEDEKIENNNLDKMIKFLDKE